MSRAAGGDAAAGAEVPIVEPDALAALCERLATEPFVAVDTEFVRERTYRARPCLVQLASPSEHALVDLIALDTARDLESLRRLLVDAPVLKVLHAARQDVALLLEILGEVLGPMVDTQVAAALLGLGEQLGLAGLVREVAGRELPKEETRTDWARRPLTPEQLEYAAADVTVLVPTWIELRGRLEEAGRLDWVLAEGEALRDPALHRTEDADAWNTVRGARRLPGRSLAILQALAAWRERRAARIDRPRRWVLSDDVLIDLAREAPTSEQDVAAIAGFDERRRKRLAAPLLRAIREGASRNAPSRPARLDRDLAPLVDDLVAIVRDRAAEEGVEPTLLASRRTVERFVARAPEAEAALLRGWRREVVGDALAQRREAWLQASKASDGDE